ncbi:cation:proton antiporter [Cyanobium sp. ATX 6A2]|uniref:cation:proton antiporter domain-containing protein n=1 Tax=Cyanobium sp. ATX 6A2 TaxID=2823700 RepID=UPI0020CBEA18|nr:cation:proton antiporter [Cyanobium sp. ATX 6A2]MCP9886378.1 cation:proton antiporter [Cyanobium sp. ATX 6A2]
MTAFLATNPLALFALLLGLSVVVPPLIRRLGLPDLVGLLAAGVLIGPHGLGWLSAEGEVVRLFSDLGVVYLLFIAGLEIDLAEFARIRQRSFRFGLLTFLLPLLTGLLLGLGFGYSLLSSVLLGSILSSHTPLGYPIVRSYGEVRDESVVVAIGGTIFTDLAALVLLALCMGLHRGEASALELVALPLRVGLFGALVLVLIRRLGRPLVRRSVNNDTQLFVVVLMALFLASLGAELAGVEKIVGAFLAGLAVNGVLPEGRVKEQVIFVGAALFIPIFFISLGLLLNLPAFASTLFSSPFALLLITGLVGAKGLASWWAGRLYGYSAPQVLTLWSLSIPQVAATLAATFVGYRAGLLDEMVLNSVLALMVVTATLGPYLTAVAMPRLGRAKAAGLNASASGQRALARRALRVLVPVSNPDTEAPLLQLAHLLMGGEADQPGELLPLAVVSTRQGQGGGPSLPALASAMVQARSLLQRAEAISKPWQVPCRSLLRVDQDLAGGIALVAVEQASDLVLMGLTPPSPLGRWLFGDLVDATCRQAPCPVVVAHLPRPPEELRRLLVPIKDLTAGAMEQFQLAQRLALALGGEITLLHLHDPRLSRVERQALVAELQQWQPSATAVPLQVVLQSHQGVESAILAASHNHDLVILRSQRRLVAGLPIPASDLTSQLLRRLTGSVLVISDPLH